MEKIYPYVFPHLMFFEFHCTNQFLGVCTLRKYTRNEWGTFKSTLETSGEDVKLNSKIANLPLDEICSPVLPVIDGEVAIVF